MSPRHFSRMMETKEYKDHMANTIKPGMNIWFAFFASTGLDKTISKLFVFTPKIISNNIISDTEDGK